VNIGLILLLFYFSSCTSKVRVRMIWRMKF
jgi:hypothetical protein